MKNAFVLAMMVSLAACATSAESEEETATPAADESVAPAAKSASATEHQFCEPGPPSNWCQNRVNKPCSSEGLRSRCYIPNYCEWGMVQCQSGIWVLIDPS